MRVRASWDPFTIINNKGEQMSDAKKEELENQIKSLKTKLDALKLKLEEMEIRDCQIQTKHVTYQLSEQFKSMTWQEAMDLPRLLNEKKYLGFDDWYLPDAAELFSLRLAGWRPKKVSVPTTTNTYNNTHTYYSDDSLWSSTQAKDNKDARKVDFEYGSIALYGVTNKCIVICVRVVNAAPKQDTVAPPAEVMIYENNFIVG
jgi:uncharacterized Rmd1/YagE family protein